MHYYNIHLGRTLNIKNILPTKKIKMKKTALFLTMFSFSTFAQASTDSLPAVVSYLLSNSTTCKTQDLVQNFTLTAPANDAVIFRNKKFVVSMGCKMNGLRVEYWADNRTKLLAKSTSYPYSVNIDTSLLANGEHTVEAILYNSRNQLISSKINTIISFADSFKNANEYHVTVDGTPSGNGSLASPWDMQTALGDLIAGKIVHTTPIKAGDIIWVHGGNYDNDQETLAYKTYLKGTKEKPIIIRAFGDGPVDIHFTDSSKPDSSAYNWFWGFEPHINRTERNTGTGYTRLQGFSLHQKGHNVINNIIYNNGHPAIGSWVNVGEAEIYGNIIWGNGIYQPSGLTIRGSAIYTQNNEGRRRIRDVITFRNFTNGIKPYTEGSYTNNYHIEGTVGFKNGSSPLLVVAANNAIHNLTLIDNFTYKEPNNAGANVYLGYANSNLNNTGLIMRGNYFMGGSVPAGAVSISQWDNVIFENNTLITKYYTGDTGGLATPRLFTYMDADTSNNISWNSNTYYGGRDSSLGDDNFINYYTDYIDTSDRFANYIRFFNLAGWQSYKSPFDNASSWTRNYPQDNAIFVRPNLYERGRGHVIVYNWKSLDKVRVNISTLGLDEGEQFEVRDVQNYFVPILNATYSHENPYIDLPMNLTDIDPIVGNVTHMDSKLTHTSNKFSTFVVLKK